ncbi:MAG: hypothetical protein LBV28_04455, partial [Puniceicoccales bacterium]|nr:hypothetical protein [Puniceicoccales bacterium]
AAIPVPRKKTSKILKKKLAQISRTRFFRHLSQLFRQPHDNQQNIHRHLSPPSARCFRSSGSRARTEHRADVRLILVQTTSSLKNFF